MTTVVCIGNDEYSFKFWNGSCNPSSVVGKGVIKGLEISMESWTEETEMQLDCKFVLDAHTRIAYITCAKGEKEDGDELEVDMSTLRAASGKDRHWALEWESLKMIEDAVRLINGYRWRLVVCDPECEAHKEAVRRAVYAAETASVDCALVAMCLVAKSSGVEMVEDVVSVIKRMVLDERATDKLFEVPVTLVIPE